MNTVLLFSLFTILCACTGQSTTGAGDTNTTEQFVTSVRGETVSNIDKGIWAIHQDKQQHFWFGSNGQGVYRYDGKTIIHYTTKDGLCHNQIRKIQEDKEGNIYFTTDGGISRFDGKTFITLPVIKSTLWALHPEDLWFTGAQDSGVVYRYDGTTLHRLEFPKTKAGNDFVTAYPRAQYPAMTFSPYDLYSIYKDRAGNLLFGTNIGLCRYDGKNFDWMSERELGIDAISFHVRATIEDHNGKFWFSNILHRFDIYPRNVTSNKNGSISYKQEKGIVDSQDHDAAYFLSGLEDDNGNMWMVTYNKGVWKYDGKSLTQYYIKDGNEDATLFTIYKDHKGVLWVGTHTAGAYKFNGEDFEPFKP